MSGYDDDLQMDGYNIWPALNNLGPTERSLLVYNLDMDDQSANFQFAVRKENWKIIWGHPKMTVRHNRYKKPKIHDVRLYDLDKDPTERKDLSEEEPEKVTELKELIVSLLKEMKATFSPNRLSLAFPRYQSGLVRPGWCEAGWEDVLWGETRWDSVLEDILEGSGSLGHHDYSDYYYQ